MTTIPRQAPVLLIDSGQAGPELRRILDERLAERGIELVLCEAPHCGVEYLRLHPETQAIVIGSLTGPWARELLLSNLRRDPALRRIPVVFVGSREARQVALGGAAAASALN